MKATGNPQHYRRNAAAHEETAASARTLRLLEQERSKYQFFAAMSQEIQFEYTTNPPMLVTSEWGAAQLGIDEIIIDPLRNLSIKRILGGKNLKTLIQMLRQTTPEQAVVQFECILHLHKQARWHRIVARATWSDEEPPQYIGAIGKVTDIHEEHLHMQNLQHMASHDALTGLLNHAADGR